MLSLHVLRACCWELLFSYCVPAVAYWGVCDFTSWCQHLSHANLKSTFHQRYFVSDGAQMETVFQYEINSCCLFCLETERHCIDSPNDGNYSQFFSIRLLFFFYKINVFKHIFSEFGKAPSEPKANSCKYLMTHFCSDTGPI